MQKSGFVAEPSLSFLAGEMLTSSIATLLTLSTVGDAFVAAAHLVNLPFLAVEDQQSFRVAFQESLRTRVEMNAYLRLQCVNGFIVQHTPQSQVLFELKGYPLYIDNESTSRCFFAVAKPFPSRNVTM